MQWQFDHHDVSCIYIGMHNVLLAGTQLSQNSKYFVRSTDNLGEEVRMAEGLAEDDVQILAWWHEAISGVSQQFAYASDIILIYFSIAKKS